MVLRPGTTVGGYDVLAPLGAGGMGEVYLARDRTLGREVALKVLPAEVANDPDRLARFQREARTVASLNHPNIVTIHAVEEAQGVRFLVMERIEGRPLADDISPGGLPVTRILEIAIAIADALAAAHDKGIVHRDLKPANVMVTNEGRVKVLDFGLAKMAPVDSPGGGSALPTATHTGEGRLVGTLPYMAPEQLRGERVDTRTDIFAFGTMLYEMAAGVRPFVGTSSVDLMSAILREDPPPIDTVRPGLPARFARILKRCLEKDPRRRVQSAADLRAELEDLADELRSTPAASGVAGAAQTHAPSSGGVAPAGPAPRRARRRALAVAGLPALLVLVTAGVLFYRTCSFGRSPGGLAAITSVAVLPFDNMNHDPAQDYFVEGIHEALITDLAKLGTLKVTSRNSVMRYTGRTVSLKDVASELGVDALIEGSVLRVGTQVRITAQLILGRTDEHAWANVYDRDMQDVLSLLSEVSHAIAGEVQARSGGGPVPAPEQAETKRRVRPEAYEEYLRGRRALKQGMSWRSAAEAYRHYERATLLDPGFAAAWSGMAFARGMNNFMGGPPLGEPGSDPRHDALKALQLDSRDGEAYAVLGAQKLYTDWDFEGARPLLEKAIALSPHDSITRHSYADYFMITGQFETSLEQVRMGRDADPISAFPQAAVFFHAMALRRFDVVIEEGRLALKLFPAIAPMAHGAIGDALWRQGKHEDALPELKLSLGQNADGWRAFEDAYRRGGPQRAYRAYGDYLAAHAAESGGTIAVAAAYAEGGDADQAMPWLEKALSTRRPQLLHVPANPAFDAIRDDPRFGDLLRRIGVRPR